MPEKSSSSSQLGGRQDDPARKFEKSPPRLQVELVCQDGTRSHDPFWDAPRLTSPFVAQLLGQVMPGAHEATIRNAYGAAAPRMALLVDRKS